MGRLASYKPLLAAVMIFVLIFVILYRFAFLNSSIFVAIVAFFVGSFAIYLYIEQKIDHKKDAGNIILMEIRNAERIIDSLRAGLPINSDILLLPTNNWMKSNFLFIGDLDRDELDLVNNFYNQCSLIDKSLSKLNIADQLKQKSNYIHKKLVELANDITHVYTTDLQGTDFAGVQTLFNIQKNNFLKVIANEGYVFSPDNPKNEIRNALQRIEKVTTSTAGDKLKKIAKLT